MKDNCCKELGYNLSKTLLINNGTNFNYLLLSQFKMCMDLKKLGSKFNNCLKYENILSK